ncbi:MAG: alcohol dehydrogenase catalytic domain-containing protein [Phycisphaerales bacterium JB039]
MRAIVCEAGRIRFDPEHAAPVPGPGEAIVRVSKALVTGFEAEIATGARRHAGVMGHAFVGTVQQAAGGSKFAGRRIVAAPDIICGLCDLCRAGLSRHCRDRVTLGRDDRDGCFCELVRLPERNLVEVPRALDDDAAVMAPVVAAAIHAAQYVRLEGKVFVTVIGDGIEALAVAQVTRPLNATVRLLGWRPAMFGLCEKWGVRHRHADDAGQRRDQTVVIDCEGTARSLQLAVRMLRPRGTLILTRAPAPGEGADLRPVIDAELEVLGSRTGPIADALALLERGAFDAHSLIGRRMRLEDGPAGISAVATGQQLSALLDIG